MIIDLHLETFLNYKNDRVASRYQKDFPNSNMHADDALKELMKFIWLNQKHESDKLNDPDNKELNFTCMMHAEMLDIDHMWHTFILFTKDYHTFCQDYLKGRFFHHNPATASNKPSTNQYELELNRYLSYIYDQLGKETLITWFGE